MDNEKKQRLIALRDSMKEYGYADGVEELESIFPELTESEDERIRQALIDLVSTVGEYYLKPDSRNKMIAYLERQKEPAPIPDKFSGLKSLMLQYLQIAANRKDDAEIENDTDLWGRKILDYVWKYDGEEKQKEQKPSEWSEEDEKMLTSVKLAIRGNDWRNDSEKKEMYDWLENRLKSLRPSWKPSEEQMAALSYALQVMNTDLSPIAARTYQGLQEIQQNLKKM